MKTTTTFSKIVAMKKSTKVIQGGTSAGKTYSILQILNYVAEKAKKQLIISVVTDTTPNLKIGAIRDFMNIRMGEGIWDDKKWNATDKIYKFPKAIIEFIAFDKPNKAQGGRRDILFVNECNRLNYEIVDQLMVRTKGDTYLDYNPTVEFWVHEKGILQLKSTEFLKVNYRDNEELDQRIIDKIEEKKPKYDEVGNLISGNVNWWRIYGEGELGVYEGLIFKQGEHWDIEDTPKEAEFVAYGLDFGYSNDPSTLVAVYLHEGQIYCKEIFYQTGLTTLYRDDMTDDEKLSTIQYKLEVLGIEKNSRIWADSSRPDSIEDLRRLGYDARGAKKGKGSVLAGIDFLQSKRVLISSHSINAQKEAKSYCWKEKNGKHVNEPEDMNNHFWDALRYATTEKRELEEKQPPELSFEERIGIPRRQQVVNPFCNF